LGGELPNPPGVTQNIVKIIEGTNQNIILYSFSNRIFKSPIGYSPGSVLYVTIDRVKPATNQNKRSIVFTADKTGNIFYIDKNPPNLYNPLTPYYGGIYIIATGALGKYLNVNTTIINEYYQIASLAAITTSSKTSVDVTSMIMDSSNNLYFTDAEANVVRKISTDGTISTIASGYGNPETPFDYPTNLTFDNNGALCLCDLNGIYKLSSTSSSTSSLVQPDFTSCPPGSFLSADLKSCVRQCPANQFIAKDDNRCVLSCPI